MYWMPSRPTGGNWFEAVLASVMLGHSYAATRSYRYFWNPLSGRGVKEPALARARQEISAVRRRAERAKEAANAGAAIYAAKPGYSSGADDRTPPGTEQTMQTSPVLPAWPPLVSAPSPALPTTRELLQASPTRPDTERAATTIDVLNIVLTVCSAFEETLNALPEVLFMTGRPWYRLSGARVAQKGRGQRLLSYGVTGRKGLLKGSVHSLQLRAYAGRG
jgi:hypothetical protein